MSAEGSGRLRRAVGADDAGHIESRTLIVMAHPDDETLMLGARLGRFVDATLLHVTDGAPRSGHDQRAHGFATARAYRAARQAELAEVLRRSQSAAMPRRCLNVPDQDAALALPQITLAIGDLLDSLQPEVVMTHAYEGGHPDHDACAYAVHAAVRRYGGLRPMIVEGTFYHAGPSGMVTSAFLPYAEATDECTCMLTDAERVGKQALLDCFVTQRETLRQFPVEAERFRQAPAYDFAVPPHAGVLFYEGFPWGMQGRRFNELVADAERSLRGVPA